MGHSEGISDRTVCRGVGPVDQVLLRHSALEFHAVPSVSGHVILLAQQA